MSQPICAFGFFGGEYSLLELRKARRAIQAQEAELTLLRAEVEQLRARADSLENDPVMLERIARERFGMIKDGEILYRFAEPQDTAGDTLR